MSEIEMAEMPEVVITANLPTNLSIPPDIRLMEAAQLAERTNEIMPILKEELRARIMLQRLKRGDPVIKLEENEPIKYELTSEELEKKRRRRKQNCEAARRCRSKKRQRRENFLKWFEEMETRRLTLEQEVADLRRQKQDLESQLRDHILSPQCHFNQGSYHGYHETQDLSAMLDLEPSIDESNESLFAPWQLKPDVDSSVLDIPPADSALSGDESAFDLSLDQWEGLYNM